VTEPRQVPLEALAGFRMLGGHRPAERRWRRSL